MSKSSLLWVDRDERVPLTLSEPTSGARQGKIQISGGGGGIMKKMVGKQ